MTSRKYLLISLAAVLYLFLLTGQPVPAAISDSRSRLQESLNKILENKPTTTLGFTSFQPEPSIVDKDLLSLYQKNNTLPYWVTSYGPNRKAEDLLSVLNAAKEEGLSPDDYRITDIHNIWESKKPEDLAKLEVMLTLAMGAYVTDMREGRAVACLLDPKLFAAARDHKVNSIEEVRQGLTSQNLVQFLHQQAPQHFGYQSLKNALAYYRELETQGGWPEIPVEKVLKPGMRDNRIDLLINRLTISGDLKFPITPPNTYDDQLVEAVKHFQYRYNLEQDGIIGRKTLAALNIPVQDHIRRIIINMERWRWLPHSLDGRRLLVNIAGFHLSGFQDEKQEIIMPVIVGKVYHKTPVFSHTMRYIEFNPYWNIPDSIAEKEMVPMMINDPDYLQKQHIRIFDGWQENAPEVDPAAIDWQTIGKGIKKYRLRQDPGPDNALGTIKFMFPNKYNVYMHDTPTHNLFKNNNRSFSHGCIRVSRARDLALYILGKDDNDWSKERIDSLIKQGKRTVIVLKKPFPVHILYRTVFVDSRDNTVHFYDDVYGRDTLLARALFTDKQPVQCRYSYN